MIERLLIANRGEIAVRIAATASRLGVGTVGVYSEPDRNALHTDSVDVAIALGGAAPADSYLRGEAVVAAALASGCDAVHPGYGFLAENAEFARAVIGAGLVWVGPTPEQIELLGDKVAAKRVAIAAGVPTTDVVAVRPGAVPASVPLPALVKAAAGGGGRGMRVIRSMADLPNAVAAAAREAESAFGDPTVFVEPFIDAGRHVEVQILGDRFGNILHLGERECSIQRRNQKVIEEAPSPGIDATTRATLLRGAVDLADHVGYQNAGTVEFLVGEDGTITFLEVNTRLQVEHPVTEAITGLDLVELQLRVAAGEALPITQDDVSFDGHAIEVRLVAEDPAEGWLPSTGRIDRFSIGDGVRVDAGFAAGGEISVHYDSLLAKVVGHGPDRRTAARRLAGALRRSEVAGVTTNLAMVAATLVEPDFLAGRTLISYLADHPAVLGDGGPTGDDRIALLVGAALAHERVGRLRDVVTGFAPSGWRNVFTVGQRQKWGSGADRIAVEICVDGDAAEVLIGDWPEPDDDGRLVDDDRRRAMVRRLRSGPGEETIEVDGRRMVVRTEVAGDTVHTSSRAGACSWTLEPRFTHHDAGEGGGGPVCPLPGTVIAVQVSVGDRVADGQVLMVVEAMKMEHQITATTAARVIEVRFGVGDRVDAGDLLVALEADNA